jgi:hypothetical protein
MQSEHDFFPAPYQAPVDVDIPRGKVGRRRSVWAWIRVSALETAHLRLDGQTGEVARLAMMHRLEDLYDEHNFSPEHTSGVAALGPDGRVVAMYYGPNDARNTDVNFARYSIQHGLVIPEVLIPLRRGAANELSPNAYLPAAARGRDFL